MKLRDIFFKNLKDIKSIDNRLSTIPLGLRPSNISWSSYWTSLISATVENAAPTNVVLTFPTAQTSLGASDFTIPNFTISMASWIGSVLTLVISPAVLVFHGNLTITFVVTGDTAIITNNVVDDGNTVAWYDSSDLSTITKDESNRVSRWNDKFGSGHDLIQNTAGLQPLYVAGQGIYFEGDRMMQTAAFTFNQPVFVTGVLKMNTKTNGARIIDGIPGSTCTFYQGTANPETKIYAGTESLKDQKSLLNVWYNFRYKFHGASSKFQIGNVTGLDRSGNYGATNAGGITLFCDGGGSLYKGHGTMKEVIFRKSYSDDYWDSLYAYTYNRWLGDVPIENVTQKLAFLNKQLGAIFHWNMGTFQNKDWADANQALDTFAPTDLDIDQWLDACVSGGIGYAYLTAQHVDGFALWPTDYHVTGYAPYSVEGTTWYINNGQPDVVKLFVDGCNARGILPCLYYSIWNTTFETRIGGDESVYGAEYIVMIKQQLTELLTNYGTIGAIWLDAWDLDNFSANYPEIAYIPWDDIWDHVKAIQPNCLFIVPEHAGRGKFNSQITVYETTIDGSIPSDNIRPAEQMDTIRIDNTWFHNNTLDQTATALLTAAQINTVKTTSNNYKGTFCIGLTPDRSGHLPDAQVTILGEL